MLMTRTLRSHSVIPTVLCKATWPDRFHGFPPGRASLFETLVFRLSSYRHLQFRDHLHTVCSCFPFSHALLLAVRLCEKPDRPRFLQVWFLTFKLWRHSISISTASINIPCSTTVWQLEPILSNVDLIVAVTLLRLTQRHNTIEHWESTVWGQCDGAMVYQPCINFCT